MMHATLYAFSAIVLLYQIFINGVVRFYEVRTSRLIEQKESCVPVSLFPFLSTIVIKDYAVYRTNANQILRVKHIMEFNKCIAKCLVTPYPDGLLARIGLQELSSIVQISRQPSCNMKSIPIS